MFKRSDTKTWFQKRSLSAGFTLIELLVVIAIISLLISILLPSLNTARDLAKKSVCSTNLRTMAIGINLIASENSGIFSGAFVGQSLGLEVGPDWGGAGVAGYPRTLGSAGYELFVNAQVPAAAFFCPTIVDSVGNGLGSPEALAEGFSTPAGFAYCNYIPRCSIPAAGENMAAPWRICTFKLEEMGHQAVMADYFCSLYPVSAHPFVNLQAQYQTPIGGWNVAFNDGSVEFQQMDDTDAAMCWPTYWQFWVHADEK